MWKIGKIYTSVSVNGRIEKEKIILKVIAGINTNK